MSKKNSIRTMLLTVAIALAAISLSADDKIAQAPEGMPPMGPPAEMKALGWLVGDWDFTSKMKMDPASTDWMDSKGTATYSYMFDGATMIMEIEQPMMGMQFKGGGFQCYDRETKMWQMSWTDNMSGRLSTYTGTHSNDSTVFTGEDIMGGQKMLTRMTSYNESPTSYDWKMEVSMDGGKTFMTMMESKYTKKKA